MSPVVQTVRRCDLRLAKFYHANVIAAQTRQAHWIGRDGGVARLFAEALWWRRFSNRWAARIGQESTR